MLKLDLQRTGHEHTLIERARVRDAEAFGQLYDMHVVRVYRHIYYLVNSVTEAEDLTAQTFLQAWEAVDRFEDRGVPLVSWLLRIAHNLAISHLRARREGSQLHEGLVDHDSFRNPERVVEQQADGERIRQAILRLGDEQRQVILLRFVEDLEYSEVAEIIAKSVPAIRVIQHRALCNLRKLMRAEGDGRHLSATNRLPRERALERKTGTRGG
jgi:RNA polymerase sigma-70 factor (ECF subfamily)